MADTTKSDNGRELLDSLLKNKIYLCFSIDDILTILSYHGPGQHGCYDSGERRHTWDVVFKDNRRGFIDGFMAYETNEWVSGKTEIPDEWVVLGQSSKDEQRMHER